MSADNWTICPKCFKEATLRKEEERRKVIDSYGKIEISEFLKLDAKAKENPAVSHTLREDYAINTLATGEFYISYKARCSECNFSFEYKHSEFVNTK